MDNVSLRDSINVEDVAQSLQNFGWIDYICFITMLLCCTIIGVYYGVQSSNEQKSNKNNQEKVALNYIVGGRTMSTLPVALSLLASLVSGVSFLGLSTETYLYGTSFMFMTLGMIISGVILHCVFLPVFVELKLTSTYEYLETRFDRRARLFGAVLFSLGTLLKLPIVIYIPALALNQVSGLNIHVITVIMCLVCIFYTSIGGIKAVVWTDTLQIVIMLGTLFSVIFYGVIKVGGLETVIEKNIISGRIEYPPINSDLTERHSLFSILIGGSVFFLQQTGISQCATQRFLSLPTLNAARKTLWIVIVGSVIITLCSNFNGLLIYAKYHNCDPLTTKLVKIKDQLLPFFVMDIFREKPGLPGLFIAGIFSATMSTLSTALNSLSAIFYQDFVKPYVKTPLSENSVNNVLRFVVVIYGTIAVALVLVVEKLGTVLQLSMTVSTITIGPLLSLFLIGLMIPWIKGKSAFIGTCVGLIVLSWIGFKAQLLAASGGITFAIKPLNVQECSYNFTISDIGPTIDPLAQEKTIYHLSYLWYTILGTIVSLIVACISSCIFGWNKPTDVDESAIAPFVRKYFQNNNITANNEEYNKVEQYKTVMHEFSLNDQ